MRVVLILLTTTLASLVSIGHAATPIGNTAIVLRDVTGLLEQNVRRLVVRDAVFANEEVQTGVESASELVFLDRTNLTVGPETRLVLDRFIFDPDPSRASFAITATKGVFRFVSGTMANNSYVIRTPTAIIGVRGTTFACVVTAVSTACTSEDGAIIMSAGNRVIDVPAGEWGTLPPVDEREPRSYSYATLPPSVAAAIASMNSLVRLGRFAVLSPNELNRGIAAEPQSGGSVGRAAPAPAAQVTGPGAAGLVASPSGF